jgi:hypothetical protein
MPAPSPGVRKGLSSQILAISFLMFYENFAIVLGKQKAKKGSARVEASAAKVVGVWVFIITSFYWARMRWPYAYCKIPDFFAGTYRVFYPTFTTILMVCYSLMTVM